MFARGGAACAPHPAVSRGRAAHNNARARASTASWRREGLRIRKNKHGRRTAWRQCETDLREMSR
jgi:hypothetical protein